MNLGLDELMIVNPGSGSLRAPGAIQERASALEGRYFLGEDGSLYQVLGTESAELAELAGAGTTVGGFFLGDDGTLYQLRPERPR